MSTATPAASDFLTNALQRLFDPRAAASKEQAEAHRKWSETLQSNPIAKLAMRQLENSVNQTPEQAQKQLLDAGYTSAQIADIHNNVQTKNLSNQVPILAAINRNNTGELIARNAATTDQNIKLGSAKTDDLLRVLGVQQQAEAASHDKDLDWRREHYAWRSKEDALDRDMLRRGQTMDMIRNIAGAAVLGLSSFLG